MTPWVRHGECNGCGRCCEVLARGVTVLLGIPPGLGDDYLEARHLTVVDGFASVRADAVAPCPQLTPQKRCRIEATKPQFCREYPTTPQEIAGFPCSYWFERDGERWGGEASPYPGRQRVTR